MPPKKSKLTLDTNTVKKSTRKYNRKAGADEGYGNFDRNRIAPTNKMQYEPEPLSKYAPIPTFEPVREYQRERGPLPKYASVPTPTLEPVREYQRERGPELEYQREPEPELEYQREPEPELEYQREPELEYEPDSEPEPEPIALSSSKSQSKNRTPLYFAIFITIFGIGLFTFGIVLLLQKPKYDNKVAATITAATCESGTLICKVDINYNANGTTYVKKDVSVKSQFKVGDRIDILYDTTTPDNFIVPSPYWIHILFGTSFTILSLLMIIAAWWYYSTK